MQMDQREKCNIAEIRYMIWYEISGWKYESLQKNYTEPNREPEHENFREFRNWNSNSEDIIDMQNGLIDMM